MFINISSCSYCDNTIITLAGIKKTRAFIIRDPKVNNNTNKKEIECSAFSVILN